ncbi:ComEC/Rec2 family competence protein [Clostridium boliviensis]|uniref:ComEC/Rec2 family competence protein n=1 Tax=Clostridium boliviensis TaxID=318465 RepID=A0ABU4GS35_9CLOT|nr:ComEC/Rec2 family competence protein [Clostridium boliviensis]MDW2800455.1 ComEC/Rec2 family competence protein [Clostridium boliviensis]
MTTNMAGNTIKRILALAAVLCMICLTGCAGSVTVSDPSSAAAPGESGEQRADSRAVFHFIDVGQGDSTLIEANGHYMLIDAGERDQTEAVTSYLKEQGVRNLDYVIGTHPHSDHIGGLEGVIREFEVANVILPQKEHTTRTYERLLDAIEDRNCKITIPKAGESYSLGAASFQIISPNRDYDDNLNNWSIGIRFVFGETSFVLCGDAEKEAEEDMLSGGLALNADVLKVSHHGSSTSSSPEFINAVSPRYAVISCGRNNDYGHPHKETLDLLKKQGIKVLRTDQLGTIVIESNGTDLQVMGQNDTSQGTSKQTEESLSGSEYIINTNTGKFHLTDCKLAESIKEENRRQFNGTRQELIDQGLKPCKSCNP